MRLIDEPVVQLHSNLIFVKPNVLDGDTHSLPRLVPNRRYIAPKNKPANILNRISELLHPLLLIVVQRHSQNLLREIDYVCTSAPFRFEQVDESSLRFRVHRGG